MWRKSADFHVYGNDYEIDDKRIEDLLLWYGQYREHTLVVNFWLMQDIQEHIEQVAWAIMRFRMRKSSNRGDPKFNIAIQKPLSPESLDLFAGLDTRLPRILLSPWAKMGDDIAKPQEFLKKFEESLSNRLLEVRPLFILTDPDEKLNTFINELHQLLITNGLGRFQPPLVEIPYKHYETNPAALCRSVAALWKIYPDLTNTLGWYSDGFIKRFYQMKEIWHLSHMLGRVCNLSDFSELKLAAVEQGASESFISIFDETFLSEFATAENYSLWRPTGGDVVLEFDLDSISDSHECQSPIFLNGKWILDRQEMFHEGIADE